MYTLTHTDIYIHSRRYNRAMKIVASIKACLVTLVTLTLTLTLPLTLTFPLASTLTPTLALTGTYTGPTSHCRVIVLDPPRCGLDKQTLDLASKFEQILYISCNPAALAKELASTLGHTHSIAAWALFDSHPYTAGHCEVGVRLVGKQACHLEGLFGLPPTRGETTV
jgi:hypothetical protein